MPTRPGAKFLPFTSTTRATAGADSASESS